MITHFIREDISQSCSDLSVMRKGRVCFRGAPTDLIEAARGHVWMIQTDGARPNDNLTIAATLQMARGTVYRAVGQPAPHYHAEPAEPSLEDGYLWLMREEERVLA
jgi:ABC-type multidrug transport system ATPase subunit